MPEARYEIIVRGPLPEAVVNEVTQAHGTLEMRTVLIGYLRDQSELQSLLRRIHGLGLELLELHQVPEAPEGAPMGAPPTFEGGAG